MPNCVKSEAYPSTVRSRINLVISYNREVNMCNNIEHLGMNLP